MKLTTLVERTNPEGRRDPARIWRGVSTRNGACAKPSSVGGNDGTNTAKPARRLRSRLMTGTIIGMMVNPMPTCHWSLPEDNHAPHRETRRGDIVSWDHSGINEVRWHGRARRLVSTSARQRPRTAQLVVRVDHER